MPSKALNPINVIARIVDALRKECPGEGVCTVCHIDGGSNTNIIPATAKIEGTVRFLKDGVGREIETVFLQCRGTDLQGRGSNLGTGLYGDLSGDSQLRRGGGTGQRQ